MKITLNTSVDHADLESLS